MKNICNGFVYRWTNNVNGKWYIGSHQGTIDDGYIGNGVLFKKAITKYGIDSFSREILYEGKQFRKKEQEYLNRYDAAENIKSYNLKNIADGGSHKGHTKSVGARQNISKAKLGENNPMYGKIPWNKGIPRTQEQKLHHSKIMKGQEPPNKGIPDTNIKCPHCDKQGGNSVMHRWHFENCGRLDRTPWNKGKTGVQIPWNKGQKGLVKHTAESNEKRSLALKGKLDKIVECPHCNKTGGISVMKRWHFERCKDI